VPRSSGGPDGAGFPAGRRQECRRCGPEAGSNSNMLPNSRGALNATKSGTGRPWERKFLGFRVNREKQIEVAPESLERFRTKVREKWRS
jgi:hypothetical protein